MAVHIQITPLTVPFEPKFFTLHSNKSPSIILGGQGDSGIPSLASNYILPGSIRRQQLKISREFGDLTIQDVGDDLKGELCGTRHRGTPLYYLSDGNYPITFPRGGVFELGRFVDSTEQDFVTEVTCRISIVSPSAPTLETSLLSTPKPRRDTLGDTNHPEHSVHGSHDDARARSIDEQALGQLQKDFSELSMRVQSVESERAGREQQRRDNFWLLEDSATESEASASRTTRSHVELKEATTQLQAGIKRIEAQLGRSQLAQDADAQQKVSASTQEMSTNDRAHYDEVRRLQERVSRLEDERNQRARITSVAAQVGEQSAKASEDSAKRLQSIFDLLAEQTPNFKASAASIEEHVSSIDKHMSSLNHILKPNQNSERLIPLAGLECVPKLTRIDGGSEFYEWRHALSSFLCFHPTAMPHLRMEEYGVGMNEADPDGRTARYNAKLDNELASIVSLTISFEVYAKARQTEKNYKGSTLAQAILKEVRVYHQNATL